MVSSAEELSSNLQSLLDIHSKAIEVLKAAKKKDNTEISKIVGIHHTLVSRILNRSKLFKYVEKKEGKWVKTKEIKGLDLYKSVKLSLSKGESSKSTKTSFSLSRKKGVEGPFKKEFVTCAKNNSEIYPYVYILENSLRAIILKIFEKDSNWWDDSRNVHADIRKYSETIQKAEKKYKWLGGRGNHPIYYINLDHLFKIIEKRWNLFKPIFNDQGNLRTWINESVPIRNLLAHNIKTKKTERDNIKIRTEYICRLISSHI